MKNMNKKIKKISINSFIFVGLLPFLLIVFWFISSLFLNNKISFSVLLYKQSQSDIKQIYSDKLLKGGKIAGEFKAKENYLGIVMLRFNNYVKHDFSSEDILLFKLREKGTKNWYYINNYRSGLLENNLLFPFGFPIIKDSKNKFYQFEIESLLGNDINAVELNKNNFTFLSGYQFPKSEILSSKKSTTKFLVKKSITSLTNLDFLLSSILYLLPFIIYVFIYILSPWWKRIKYLGYILFVLLLILIFSDIFFIKEFYIGVLISLILGWIHIIVKNKLESRVNFLFAFVLILLWVLLIELKITDFQNKINIWTYTFLVIGLVQAVLEEKGLLINK